MSRLRWNMILGEWVIVTPHRADRPFQDPSRDCPFCPGKEETSGDWTVLTLDNKFPSLHPEPGIVPLDANVVLEAPAYGECKVIVYSPNHEAQIENLDDDEVGRILGEYIRVFNSLDSKQGVEYVYQFENRGEAIGVSLSHPHAQVYALPFVPPRIKRELGQVEKWLKEDGSCLFCHMLQKEVEAGQRVVAETDNFVTIVPFGARLPFEVHIYPRDHVSSLTELEGVLHELASVIRDVVQRFSKLFDENSYVMAFHTRPSKGDFSHWHFHIEFYPPWRDRSRIKYLAGLETGTWVYTNDTIPENVAQELREAL
ncbi:MAG: galactose-1-phosphate uridylyltransferase [Candidatus Thorarchaeota archaeon]|nr:MAG: galactose-1-phosphate uridylyltransferase [Candidatus Thorarchaeota archaeon]